MRGITDHRGHVIFEGVIEGTYNVVTKTRDGYGSRRYEVTTDGRNLVRLPLRLIDRNNLNGLRKNIEVQAKRGHLD